jgi:hypothetical protein
MSRQTRLVESLKFPWAKRSKKIERPHIRIVEMSEIVAKTVTEVVTGILIEETVVTGILIEETAAIIIEAGVKTVSIGTTMDADISRKTIVGPAMAAPVTIVAANHAKEEEMNVAEMIEDAVIHQRIFVVTILRGESTKILPGAGATIEGVADQLDQTTARKVKLCRFNG